MPVSALLDLQICYYNCFCLTVGCYKYFNLYRQFEIVFYNIYKRQFFFIQ